MSRGKLPQVLLLDVSIVALRCCDVFDDKLLVLPNTLATWGKMDQSIS